MPLRRPATPLGRRHRRPRVCGRSAAPGFTLVELLTYTVLSGLVLWATLSVVLSTNRSNNQMVRAMRLQDRWSRLSQLIESEVAEGIQITYPAALPSECGSFSGTVNPVVQITIPYLASPTAAATTSTSISYFLSGTSFYRCGPPYQSDGRLQLGQPLVISLLTSGTSFSVDRTTSSTDRDPARVLRYTLGYTVQDGGASRLFSYSASARTRVSLSP